MPSSPFTTDLLQLGEGKKRHTSHHPESQYNILALKCKHLQSTKRREIWNTVLASGKPLLTKALLICMRLHPSPASVEGKIWLETGHFSQIWIFWFPIIVDWGGKDVNYTDASLPWFSSVYAIPDLAKLKLLSSSLSTVTYTNLSEYKNNTLWTVSWLGDHLSAVWLCGYVAGFLHQVMR